GIYGWKILDIWQRLFRDPVLLSTGKWELYVPRKRCRMRQPLRLTRIRRTLRAGRRVARLQPAVRRLRDDVPRRDCLGQLDGECAMKQAVTRFLKCRSGSSAVEFAILVLPMVLLLFGSVEAGRAFWTSQAVKDVATSVARCIGVSHPECAP